MGRTAGAKNKPKPGSIVLMPAVELPSPAKLAQKALADAISAETAQLQATLAAKDRRITSLEGQLRQIAEQCNRAVDAMIATVIAPSSDAPPELAAMFAKARDKATPQDNELPPLAETPPIDLSDEDNMGPGRWA